MLMLSVSPDTRGGGAASTACQAAEPFPHGIKLDVLTEGKRAALTTNGSISVLVGSALLCARRPMERENAERMYCLSRMMKATWGHPFLRGRADAALSKSAMF